MTIEDDYHKLLVKYLSDQVRISHSLSVARHMMKFAEKFGIDKDDAYLCGFFHDIGKELPNDRLLEYTDSFIKRDICGIRFLDFKRKHPFLLHGVASAEICLREGVISDKETLISICSHTLGGESMSPLSSYTFIMDFCEPMRTHHYADKIYKIITAKGNFKKALYLCYMYQIKDLLAHKKEICPETIYGYNEALTNLYR